MGMLLQMLQAKSTNSSLRAHHSLPLASNFCQVGCQLDKLQPKTGCLCCFCACTLQGSMQMHVRL